MAERADQIPNQFQFVWDDKFFPYAYYLAIRSVAMRCPALALRRDRSERCGWRASEAASTLQRIEAGNITAFLNDIGRIQLAVAL